MNPEQPPTFTFCFSASGTSGCMNGFDTAKGNGMNSFTFGRNFDITMLTTAGETFLTASTGSRSYSVLKLFVINIIMRLKRNFFNQKAGCGDSIFENCLLLN